MKILIAAGASGGHIFPALSLIKTLKNTYRNIDTLLVLPQRAKKAQVSSDQKIKYISLTAAGLRLSLKNLAALSNLFKGSVESLRIMFNFKPDAVVGFGTLDSFPLLMLGRLLRAKTLIHEQNVMPGRANRLLARFADRTAVSFAQTKKYLGIRPERIVYTGNPVREELVKIEKAEARIFFGLNPEKFTILVLGGSQGSRSINLRFLEALQGLTGTYSLQVIHLAGDSDGPGLEEKYRNLKLEARVFSFLNQMQYAYSACDIAICRCGATTLAELIHYRLPAILIPYPYAYNHQRWNADVLEEVGAGAIIEEDKLHTDLLALTVKSFLDDPKKLEKMRACYGKLKDVNANQLLAETVISLVNGGPEMASGVA